MTDDLLRIELDDQLLLHGQVDLLARGQRHDAADLIARIEGQPPGDAPALDLLNRVRNRRRLLAGRPHGHRISGPHRIRRDVDFPAVHREVPVTYQLPRLRTRGRETEAVDHVVQPALEQLQERLTRDAALPVRRLEVTPELVLQHPVDTLDLLLLTELHAVADDLLLPRLAVLPGDEIALLDGALLGVAPLALQEQLHALPAAQPADGTTVTSHVVLCLFSDSSGGRRWAVGGGHVHYLRLKPSSLLALQRLRRRRQRGSLDQ